MRREDFIDSFARQAKKLWDPIDRKKTLSKIAYHERQFENWWKFELASQLWEMDKPSNVKIFIEQHDRADIMLAASKKVGSNWLPDYQSDFIVPIELKTVGTWWGSPKKALSEYGKKTLASDMNDIAIRRRSSNPCALAGLMITEVGAVTGKLDNFYNYAIQLGEDFGLVCILNQIIDLPNPKSDISARAVQLFWSSSEQNVCQF